MRLEIPHLRAFVTVAQLRSFTRAAEKLNLTQSAVSWQVRRLEERIGRSLFSRDTNAIGLTPHGRDFLEDAQRILAAHDHAIDGLRRSDLVGRVRFGCSEDLIAERLSGVLSRFQRTHPGVRLEVVVDASMVLRGRVECGDLDAAIVQQKSGEPPQGRHLWREQPVWVCGQNYSLDATEPIALVTFGKDCVYRASASGALEAARMDWFPVLECFSIAGVRAALAAGIGIGVLAERHLDSSVRIASGQSALPALPETDFVLAGAFPQAGTAQDELMGLMLDELAVGYDRAPAAA